MTVAEFRRFVKDTGYVTAAEQAPAAEDYADADPELLVPGSLVFRKADGPVPLDDDRNWWEWAPGADWRHPEGPASTVGGRERHPVTHVTHADATAYADGRASRCRPRPSGNTPRAAVSTARPNLCAPSYCLRYRPAARQGETIDTSTVTSASAA